MATPSLGRTLPHTPPLYQSAVYDVPDLDALDRMMQGDEPGFMYARDAHPNAVHLAAELTKLENADWGFVTASGMAALSAAILGNVSSGDHVLASDSLYGRTNRLLRNELSRFGIETEFIDFSNLKMVETCLEKHPKLVIAETISNPMLRLIDLPRLADLTHQSGSKLLVDNTFATPLLCRPLELGADLVMESLTKIINGHGDVTLGFIGGKDKTQINLMTQLISTWGFSANPFDCWLCLRGLDSLRLRLDASTKNAFELALWLDSLPAVKRVVYPNRTDHPDHLLAIRDFAAGAGHVFSFEFAGGRDAVNRFMRQVPEITFTPSLGDLCTTISHPYSTSHRYEPEENKLALGITPGLVRVSVGIERIEDLRILFERGLCLAGRDSSN